MQTSFSALAVYNRSPSAYEALRNLSILQLPCTKVLKKVLKDGAEKSGIDPHYFQSQQGKFQAYQRQRESDGHPQPLGIGVMMWDEVKVKDFDLWYQTTSYNIKIIIEMCECNLILFPLIFLFDSIKIFANKIVISGSEVPTVLKDLQT